MLHMELKDLIPITAYLVISSIANSSIGDEIEVPRWGEASAVELIRMAHGSRLVADKGYAAVEMVLEGGVTHTKKWKTEWIWNVGMCTVVRIVV